MSFYENISDTATLSLSTLDKIISKIHNEIFFQKIGFDFLCILSPSETGEMSKRVL